MHPEICKDRRSAYLKLIKGLEQVELAEECAILAEGYVSRGIFHRKYIADALHVAVASVHKIDYLLTWNHTHLSNPETIRKLKAFDRKWNLRSPLIVSPESIPWVALGQPIRRRDE